MSPDEYATRRLDIEREMQRDLTLLDDLRDAEAAIANVRARHREVDVYDLCGHDDHTDCGMWETVDGEFVCGAPVDRVCDECRDKDGERIGYPCPTIRALDRVAPMRAWGIDPGEVE